MTTSAKAVWRLLALLSAMAAALALATACDRGAETSPAPGPPDTPTPASVSFMAGFKAQANLPFVAVYVAQERGYFATQNLNVTIRHAASGEHLKLLLSGDIDVTTADAASVLNRRADPEVPIKAFALLGQSGQQGFVTLEKSGIKTVKDWEGKTFGYKTSVPPEYLAMLRAERVDRGKVKEVRVGFDPRILITGQVDILAVFKSNEPDTIRTLGFPVRVFDPADVGVPTLGLTFIATDSTLAKRPDVIERFVKATMKGVAFAKANEEETLNIIAKYAPQEDREHQRFMLRQELRDAEGPVTQAAGLGSMTERQWSALYSQLVTYEALPRPFDFKTAYDDQFIRRAYRGNKLVWP